MNLKLSDCYLGPVSILASKKNTGGTIVKATLNARMTKAVRRAMRWATDATGELVEEWPPHGVPSGKLIGNLDCTTLILTPDQPALEGTGGVEEVQVKVSLANDFNWKLEDSDDETNKTVLFSCSVRSSDVEAAERLVQYKFSIKSGSATGSLTYNKPGDGTPVTMGPNGDDEAQEELDLPDDVGMSDEALEDVEEMSDDDIEEANIPVEPANTLPSLGAMKRAEKQKRKGLHPVTAMSSHIQ